MQDNSLEVDTFVSKLEKERKLSAQLDAYIQQAEAQVKSKRMVLHGLQRSRRAQELAQLEDLLQRARVALSELLADNECLRQRASVLRKDLQDYSTKAQLEKEVNKQLSTSVQLVHGESLKSLNDALVLRTRMRSMQSLHEQRSQSTHKRMSSLCVEIQEDRKRNREVLKSLERGMKAPRQEYTESAACLRMLAAKWTEKVKSQRKALQQYTEFIKGLERGFATMNPTGADDDFRKVAAATISALHTNTNLAMQLLIRSEEAESLEKVLQAMRAVQAKRAESERAAELEVAQCESALRASIASLEQQRASTELQLHVIKDSISDLGPVLAEFSEVLSEFRPAGASFQLQVETVLDSLKGLEDATAQLGTLLLRLHRRRQTPWPVAKSKPIVPAIFLSSWEPEEALYPRTKEQFRAYANSDELLYVGFNQDASCFSLGTEKGLKIFASYPLRYSFERGENYTDFSGGIAIVEMLFRCNIIALVGGGKSPRYPPNKVMLWDDHLSRCVGELCFRTEVKAVKLRRDRIAVALEHKIYVYNFDDLHLLDTVETCHNPRGLCCMSSLPTSPVLACPDRLKGHVRLQLYCYERTVLISAHESSIACLALNKDGTLLATASDKGTLVRIFNASEGQLLQEVRRGIDRAEIYCLAFDSMSKWLACSSDKGTIHIFSVKGEPSETKNPTSTLSFMKRILPKYFDSEWSFSQFRVPDVKTVCAFGPTPGTLVVVSQEGIYYLATFDPEASGDCTQQIMRHLKDEEMRAL